MITRGGSRTAAISKMERSVIIVNDWKPLAIITKRSILDVGAVLDPPLITKNRRILLDFYAVQRLERFIKALLLRAVLERGLNFRWL